MYIYLFRQSQVESEAGVWATRRDRQKRKGGI